MAPFINSPNLFSRFRTGFTLLELALAMAIMVVLGLGVVNLVRSVVSTQQSHRIHTLEQTVALEVIDSLRGDLMTAQTISIQGGGSVMSILRYSGNTPVNVTYTYQAAAGTIIRQQAGGGTRDFARISRQVPLQIVCGSPCFSRPNTTNVSLSNLQVVDASRGTSPLDRAFGKSRFRVAEATFNVLAGTQFE